MIARISKGYTAHNKICIQTYVLIYVDLLCLFLSCVCYAFVRVCLFVLCDNLLGKGRPFGSRLCCTTMSLSLSHWYPGSGVVLDCIDS